MGQLFVELDNFRPHMDPYCGLLNAGNLKDKPQLAIYACLPHRLQYTTEQANKWGKDALSSNEYTKELGEPVFCL
jgi:hypothetical protein